MSKVRCRNTSVTVQVWRSTVAKTPDRWRLHRVLGSAPARWSGAEATRGEISATIPHPLHTRPSTHALFPDALDPPSIPIFTHGAASYCVLCVSLRRRSALGSCVRSVSCAMLLCVSVGRARGSSRSARPPSRQQRWGGACEAVLAASALDRPRPRPMREAATVNTLQIEITWRCSGSDHRSELTRATPSRPVIVDHRGHGAARPARSRAARWSPPVASCGDAPTCRSHE